MKLTFEMSDKDLDAIASAVASKMTAALGTAPKATKKAPTKAKAEPEAEVETETAEAEAADDFEGEAGTVEQPPDAEVTREDVRVALTTVSKKHGQDKAMEILKVHGKAGALSKLDESKFAAVVAAAKKLA